MTDIRTFFKKRRLDDTGTSSTATSAGLRAEPTASTSHFDEVRTHARAAIGLCVIVSVRAVRVEPVVHGGRRLQNGRL